MTQQERDILTLRETNHTLYHLSERLRAHIAWLRTGLDTIVGDILQGETK